MASASDIIKDFLYDTCNNLNDIDFFNKVVQFDNDANSVATAEASYVFSGPPVFKPEYKGRNIIDYLVPVGAVQQYSLQEGKQIIPFSELGSKLKRHAAGSGQYTANLTRVLPRYGNLYYSLYAWLPVFLSPNASRTQAAEIDLALFPGDNNSRHLISPESEFFGIPFGLLIITGSAGGDLVHVEYLERCYCQGGGYARAAGQPMVVDNASILVTRPVPFIYSESGQDGSIGAPLLKPEVFKTAERSTFTLPAPDGNANGSILDLNSGDANAESGGPAE
jgi:hypothetical protein